MDHEIRGRPPNGRMFFRGKRLEPPRAGIIATITPDHLSVVQRLNPEKVYFVNITRRNCPYRRLGRDLYETANHALSFTDLSGFRINQRILVGALRQFDDGGRVSIGGVNQELFVAVSKTPLIVNQF